MQWLVRKNGGEVLGQSTDPNVWSTIDATYFQALTDPSTPDGTALVPAKIWTGAVVRNATAPEIAAFPTAAATDANLQARTAALDMLQNNLALRKVLKGIIAALVDQLNVLGQNPTQVQSAITLNQAVNAVISKINAGTVD